MSAWEETIARSLSLREVLGNRLRRCEPSCFNADIMHDGASNSDGFLQQVLVTVTGRDSPGITARLLSVVAQGAVGLLDIEQVRVHGELNLVLLLGMNRDKGDSVVRDLLFEATQMGLGLKLKVVKESGQALSAASRRYAITVVADRVEASALYAISAVLADFSVNIESIRQLSDSGLGCFEIIAAETGGAERRLDLRRRLLEATREHEVDLAVASEDHFRRSKRLVVMDMDSTLIQIEVIDELARMHGVLEQVSTITAKAMEGKIDFESSLRERVSLLRGLPEQALSRLAGALPLTEGAEQFLLVLKTLGYKTAVISGGFAFAAEALKETLGLDYAYANVLEVSGGKLTGELVGPIVTPQRKADLLDTIAQSEGISRKQTIAIGDGANDLAMLGRAGLGIAFHAKAKLCAAADTAVSRGGLDRILYLLGLHARDVEAILGSDRPTGAELGSEA